MGNSQVKLVFPSHGMPFTIPFSMVGQLKSVIDNLLEEMATKDPTISESGKLKLPDGTVLDPPTPGDWVLIDTLFCVIVHDSMIMDLVAGGRSYMVLPMRASGLSASNLKKAIKLVNSTRECMSGKLPGYTPPGQTPK